MQAAPFLNLTGIELTCAPPLSTESVRIILGFGIFFGTYMFIDTRSPLIGFKVKLAPLGNERSKPVVKSTESLTVRVSSIVNRRPILLLSSSC
jgi:hypothetical protein